MTSRESATATATPDPIGADAALVARLRDGDEAAFALLVSRHHAQMHRLARNHVNSDAAAEEVVQETWLAVLRGLDKFEERSSLKTWLFRILLNTARREGRRRHREVSVAFSDESAASLLADDWFHPMTSEGFAGWWARYPRTWTALPESRAEARELRAVIVTAIEALPSVQRDVVVLRDIEGFDSAETCLLLDLSDGNQRVLLHRARSRIRLALDAYFDTGSPAGDRPS